MRTFLISRFLWMLIGVSLLTLGACRKDKPINEFPDPGSILSPDIIIENGVLKKWPNYDVPVSGSITIPDYVTSIADGVFSNYKDLKHVKFPAGLKSIGARAFQGCSALNNVVLPEQLQSIEEKLCAEVWMVRKKPL